MKTTAMITGVAALALAGAALAQSILPGDPAEGAKLADDLCANCHIVAQGARTDIGEVPPALQTVADDPTVTETGLRVFLQTPHENMPNVVLSEAETDHIIAYILSLK